jgi:general secretion pathway protein I
MQKTATSNRQRRNLNLQSDLGFTLLEIMVAISIIGIVLVSVYKMHAQTISMNYEARFYTTAPLLAQLKMADLETKLLEEQTNDSGDFGDEFPGYRWNVVIDDVESEALGDTAEDLKEINVFVSFNNDEFTYSLRTYIFSQD